VAVRKAPDKVLREMLYRAITLPWFIKPAKSRHPSAIYYGAATTARIADTQFRAIPLPLIGRCAAAGWSLQRWLSGAQTPWRGQNMRFAALDSSTPSSW
jgi:hypothetical protein